VKKLVGLVGTDWRRGERGREKGGQEHVKKLVLPIWAIHLTQVTTTCSMAGDGRLSSDGGGVGGAFSHGAGLPGVSVPIALADGVPLSQVRDWEGLVDAFGAVAVRRVRTPGLGDGRNDFPGHAHPADRLVSSDVVGDHTEERCECLGVAAGFGVGKLPNRLGLAA